MDAEGDRRRSGPRPAEDIPGPDTGRSGTEAVRMRGSMRDKRSEDFLGGLYI